MTLSIAMVALLAATLHVYIFWMESVIWTSPTVREVFDTTLEEAEATRELAFNQGFYNLFLATIVGIGAAIMLGGKLTIGTTLVLTGLASMFLAALVLFSTSPKKRTLAAKQGALPLIGLILLGFGLIF